MASERQKEIKRRRHRRKKLDHYKHRLETASGAEKAAIAQKIRMLTPGGDQVVHNLQLEDQ